MRALCLVAIAFITLMATDGCKRSKPEPVPGPQSGILGISAATFGPTTHKHSSNSPADTGRVGRMDAVSMAHGAGGIAWFQGTVEEAFSRTVTRGNGGANPQAVPACRGSMPLPGPDRVRKDSSPIDDDA